jgi:hypothetical protein
MVIEPVILRSGWQSSFSSVKGDETAPAVIGSGARRKLRYARLLTGAVELDRLPHPLDAVLTRA